MKAHASQQESLHQQESLQQEESLQLEESLHQQESLQLDRHQRAGQRMYRSRLQ